MCLNLFSLLHPQESNCLELSPWSSSNDNCIIYPKVLKPLTNTCQNFSKEKLLCLIIKPLKGSDIKTTSKDFQKYLEILRVFGHKNSWSREIQCWYIPCIYLRRGLRNRVFGCYKGLIPHSLNHLTINLSITRLQPQGFGTLAYKKVRWWLSYSLLEGLVTNDYKCL